ncbi:Transcription initiation factor IIF, large subunit (RAP74), partial [Ceraceosorus bombacis]
MAPKSEHASKQASARGSAAPMDVDAKPPAASTTSKVKASSSSLSNTAQRPKSPPPPTEYRDIPLLSLSNASSLFDTSTDQKGEAKVKTHLLKLVSNASLDLSSAERFSQPLRLNRKLLPKLKAPRPDPGDVIPDKYGRSILGLGDDGKSPLRWPRNRQELDQVKAWLDKGKEEKTSQVDVSQIAPTSSNAAQRNKTQLFKKRVREVHKAATSSRKTWNDERLPWILEDQETSKEWESSRTLNPSGLAALREEVEKFERGETSNIRFVQEPLTEAPTGDGMSTINISADSGGQVKREPTEMLEPAIKTDVKGSIDNKTTNHSPWLGKLEGDNGDANNHVLFVFDSAGEGGFRCIPLSKTYRFLQKSTNSLSAEEIEREYERYQKSRDNGASRWMLRAQEAISLGAGRSSRRNQSSSSSLRTGGVKKEDPGGDEDDLDSVPEWKHLLLPNGSTLSAAIASSSEKKPRDQASRQRVGGRRRRESNEGRYDELDFQEEMADDDDRNEMEGYDLGDEETHELEERMKREMAKAEASDEDEDDDFAPQDDLFGGSTKRPGSRRDDMLTGSDNQMNRIVKALARNMGNEAYEEEDNPYLSDESDESDLAVANPEKALQEVREEREKREKEEKERLKAMGGIGNNGSTSVSTPGRETPPPGTKSGNATPSGRMEKQKSAGAGSIVMGQKHKPGAGHASVAQRATSPSASANRQTKHSRANSRSTSPVAGGSGGAGSSVRATSPMSRTATNPTPSTADRNSSNKRKSEAPVSHSDMSL